MAAPVVIECAPFRVDMEQFFRKLRMDAEAEDAARVREMALHAQEIGRPKALFREVFIEERTENGVVLDGVRFTSRILRVNFDKIYRVFPYLATCGTELENWAAPLDDMLHKYWADQIMRMALNAALEELREAIRKRNPSQTSSMNPGSLEDWPIQQQRPLFELLGDPASSIGVRLTDSCLMLPTKSVSGIQFPTEVHFENCQLCGRSDCPNRRAPHDPHLYETRYGGS